MQEINKNTYYMVPRWLIALHETLKRGNGKYNLTKKDLKNGYYFKIEIAAINVVLKIPFKAIFKENTKIKGIKGLSFDTAKDCKSLKLGLCQLKDNSKCYAIVGEDRNKNDMTKNGNLKMNSYYHGLLSIEAIKQLKSNTSLLSLFIEFVNNSDNIKYIRYNINGDFKNISDFELLLKLVTGCHTAVFYGYTARDDILKGISYNTSELIHLNGSNKQYCNKYTCTYSLETYFKAVQSGKNCLGSCLGCKKCFKLVKTELINLFHNKESDKILNTFNNRLFIIKLMKAFNVKITDDDLKRFKGLFKSLNDFLIKNHGFDLKTIEITNLKDLMIELNNLHYDIMDNIELYNEELLKELNLI